MSNNSNNENKKKKGFTNWWLSLSKPMKGLLIGATTVGVSSAIVFPTLAATVWNKKEWYENQNYINSLTDDDIGKLENVTVNGQVYKVRLIGIDHDDLANGNGKAHTTWEFANLISDKNGYSLAYQWYDTDAAKPYEDYLNSSIRKILCGSGNFATSIYCATKVSIDKSTPEWDSSYTNKTIFSMLPGKLQRVLKPVIKYVRVGSSLEETEYKDILFMLSSTEVGDNITEETDTVYKYYNGADNSKRIKQQVKGSKDSLTVSKNIYSTTTVYKGEIDCYAGYNSSTESNGGYYWVRSPNGGMTGGVRYYGYNGEAGMALSKNRANGIAPAFCL